MPFSKVQQCLHSSSNFPSILCNILEAAAVCRVHRDQPSVKEEADQRPESERTSEPHMNGVGASDADGRSAVCEVVLCQCQKLRNHELQFHDFIGEIRNCESKKELFILIPVQVSMLENKNQNRDSFGIGIDTSLV